MSLNEPWEGEKIDRLLELLPILEAPDFVAATWPKLEDSVVDGVRVMQMPYPIYHPAIEQLRARAWDGPPMNPYDALPEDGTGKGIEFCVMGTHFPARVLRNRDGEPGSTVSHPLLARGEILRRPHRVGVPFRLHPCGVEASPSFTHQRTPERTMKPLTTYRRMTGMDGSA